MIQFTPMLSKTVRGHRWDKGAYRLNPWSETVKEYRGYKGRYIFNPWLMRQYNIVKTVKISSYSWILPINYCNLTF